MVKRQYFVNTIYNAIKHIKNPNHVQYKFGVQIPHTYDESTNIDHDKSNTYWHDAIHHELDLIFSYKSFCDLGINATLGPEYKKIKVHFVFNVKANGRRKPCLVASGDMTPEPKESAYSSVTTLRKSLFHCRARIWAYSRSYIYY